MQASLAGFCLEGNSVDHCKHVLLSQYVYVREYVVSPFEACLCMSTKASQQADLDSVCLVYCRLQYTVLYSLPIMN